MNAAANPAPADVSWHNHSASPSPTGEGLGGEVGDQRHQLTTSADFVANLRVYLRALEAAAVVNVDRLPLGEELERAQARLAVAVASAARAAERKLNLGADGTRVDVDDAGRQIAHRRLRRVDIVGKDAAGESVARVVVDGDGLFQRLHLDHRKHRAEDLLLLHPHAWPHVAQ